MLFHAQIVKSRRKETTALQQHIAVLSFPCYALAVMIIFFFLFVEIILGLLFFKVYTPVSCCCEEVKHLFPFFFFFFLLFYKCIFILTCQLWRISSLHQVNEVDPSKSRFILVFLLKS